MDIKRYEYREFAYKGASSHVRQYTHLCFACITLTATQASCGLRSGRCRLVEALRLVE